MCCLVGSFERVSSPDKDVRSADARGTLSYFISSMLTAADGDGSDGMTAEDYASICSEAGLPFVGHVRTCCGACDGSALSPQGPTIPGSRAQSVRTLGFTATSTSRRRYARLARA